MLVDLNIRARDIILDSCGFCCRVLSVAGSSVLSSYFSALYFRMLTELVVISSSEHCRVSG